ncbi:hypothetical protein PAPYR_11039 [Paratrimastix pyriformis]|uniref:Uncharacterized protein n=1 Tax=Paratrimastix pyriformis TaxID=342808 RepID=A0ABQ8U7I1_9EUKA|nr:hypothetical protein PAPYR_11039 [Paratrimastix pyriformis]
MKRGEYQSVPECTKMYQLVPQQVPKFCTNRWWYFTKPVYQILVVYQSGPDAPPLQAGTSPKSLGTSPKSSWYFTKITKGTNHTCHMTTLEDQVRYQTALVPSGEAPLNSPWSSSVSEAASTKYQPNVLKKYQTVPKERKVPGRVPEKYQGEYQKSTKGGYQEYQTTRYKNFLVLFGTFPLSSCIHFAPITILQQSCSPPPTIISQMSSSLKGNSTNPTCFFKKLNQVNVTPTPFLPLLHPHPSL